MRRGVSDDVFGGTFADRLEGAARRVEAAALDAQCRDWTAERADRVGHARLWQVHHELRRARAHPVAGTDDMAWSVAAVLAWIGVPVVILLLAGRPAAPLTLAAALAAGLIGSGMVLTASRLIRDRRARRLPTGPAPIDDPGFYADVSRNIEACAAEARGRDRSRSASAADLAQAMTWLGAARDELTTRTSPADR
nr:hypothetical protein [uncultured Actinoplanes sp.]